MMQDRIEFLKRVDFLRDAPSELLEQIARDVDRVAVPEGTVVLRDEEAGDAMYFIVEGAVRIEKKGQVLLTRRSREYVGEMALVDDAPRSASAVAATDGILFRWGKESFQKALESNSRFAYNVCRAFSSKIRESVEKASMIRQDLERAVQLQRAMLPGDSFENEIIALSASCIQAEKIGGDYFDYLSFDDGQVTLVMADAQGHGFAAALLVAMLKARLHSQVLRDRDPREVMAALNQTLTEQINGIQMATGIYILIDSGTRTFSYCGAGHIPQYHYRSASDDLEVLESQNLILGYRYQDGSNLRATIRSWSPGDLLVLYTDGVTETENPQGEELGVQRLYELILRHKQQEPMEIRRLLLESVQRFRGNDEVSDDVTLLVARLS